jgi:hypothetical protein
MTKQAAPRMKPKKFAGTTLDIHTPMGIPGKAPIAKKRGKRRPVFFVLITVTLPDPMPPT